MSTPPQVSIAFTAEDRGVSAAINSLSSQLKQLATQQRDVKQSALEAAEGEEVLSASMHEAKGAAALLGEEVGIKLNRHLRGVLASSETLGPILAAAFPVAAAIGFAEVIVHAAEKMSEFISNLLVYTEEEKTAYDQERAFNKALDEHVTKMAALNAQYERLGKNAVDIANLDVRDLNTALTKADTNINNLRNSLNAPVSGAGFLATVQAGFAGFLKGGVGGIGEGITEAETAAAANEMVGRENRLKIAQQGEDELLEQRKIAEKNKAIVTKEADDKAAKALEEQNKKTITEWARLWEADKKLAEDRQKLATDEAEFGIQAQAKQTETELKDLIAFSEAKRKLADENEALEEKKAIDAIALQQREIERQASLRRITGAQEEADLKALAQQKLDVEKKYLDQRLTEMLPLFLDQDKKVQAEGLEQFKKYQADKLAAEDRYNADVAAATEAAQKHLTGIQTAGKAIGGDINKFFTEGITNANSFQQAFANLAKSIISDLQKMAAQFLLTKIQKQLLGDTSGGEGGGEGGGGGGGGGGGFLGQLIGALGGGGFAGGGPVSGPGGPKSDMIPAMLSSGEFVMNAEAVKQIGAKNLEMLNMATGVTHLAAGGFTGGDVTSSSEISMGIGLDEGLILRHLGSKAAGKVILQQLTNNPKGAQRALSRTD